MARDYPKISPSEHQQILQHEILRDPRRFLNASPVDRPRAVIMAGQPGAGKGGLVKIAKTQFDSNVVTIDVDDLRGYHPLVDVLRRRHPYTWSGHTHGDAAQWAAELRQAAVAQRKNLILDTTTPRVDIIRELQAAGYEVEVRALAAHRLESEVGVEERFTSQWDNEGHGRYVPKDVRDQVYRQLPDVLNDVARKTGVPVQVYDREGRLRFDSRQAWFRSPGMALRQGRFWRMWNHDRVVDLHKASQRQIGWHRSLTRRLDEGRVPPATASHLQNERAIVQVEEGLHRHGHHLAGHRVARISLRSAGLLGIAYGAFDAKTQVDDAIDAARSSREQWVRGGEEVANQAVKAVVTGGAAVVGAVPGVVAGALTSPATGPVGPVVGGAGDR
ncbi:MAG: zeta toxin family protein [Burkholderiaceae bacterium]